MNLREVVALLAALDEKPSDDLAGILASTADALNVAARENGLPEIKDYLSLDVRDAVDRLAVRLRAEIRNLEGALHRARKREPDLLPGLRRAYDLICGAFDNDWRVNAISAEIRKLEETDG